jgi:LysR family transcriptional regulator, hydrogen peroxide-inducible genes activator
MTLSELKFVIAVAKERNFRRAAEKCYVSQPALSLAIKKLEEDLGVLIFERSRNDVSPTAIGEKIIAQATLALAEIAHIREIANQGNNQLDGPFRLGLIHSVGPYLLPDIIPILRKNAPNMPLEIEENLTAQLEIQLKNGVIDAAIVALPFEVSGINNLPLYDEQYVVLVPSNHHWANRHLINADELVDENVLLLNTGHCYSHQVLQACPDLSRKGQVLQGNSLETIRNMVASNLGITVLPGSAATDRYLNPLLIAIPFKAPIPIRRIALVWRKSYARESAIECIANAIKAIDSDCLKMLPNKAALIGQ